MTTQIARSRESGNPLPPQHGIYDVLKIVVEIYSELLFLFCFVSLFVCVFVSLFVCCCCCCFFVVVFCSFLWAIIMFDFGFDLHNNSGF